MTGDGGAPGSPRGAAVRETRVVVHGLGHHVIVWNDAAPGPGRGGLETVVLCHGFLDFAWSFRMTAEALVRRGHRVVAFDWRGHGESDWVADAGYYHFADYVRDLDALMPQLRRDGEDRVHLVGHSMGGTATTLYAAVRGADHLRSLSLLEGLGPPPIPFDAAPTRLDRFLRATAKVTAAGRRHPTPMASLDEAEARMRVRNPGMPTGELGRFLAEGATIRDDGGRLTWRFDPLHRTPNPNPIPVAAYEACLRALGDSGLPLLLVRGGDGLRWPDEASRLGHLAGGYVERLIPGVGHMLHWESPEVLAGHLDEHVRRAASAR